MNIRTRSGYNGLRHIFHWEVSVIPSKAGHFSDNNTLDLSFILIIYEPLPARTIKVTPGITKIIIFGIKLQVLPRVYNSFTMSD